MEISIPPPELLILRYSINKEKSNKCTNNLVNKYMTIHHGNFHSKFQFSILYKKLAATPLEAFSGTLNAFFISNI